jgi:hypothetical protein
MRDNEEIMNGLRVELKRAVAQRFKRIDLDRFKAELKDHVTHYLFEHTQRSPIVIPVINVISGGGSKPNQSGDNNKKTDAPQDQPETKSPDQIAAEQQKRFQEMRARLLTQDPRVD